MRSFIYRATIILMVVWTLLSVGACVIGAMEIEAIRKTVGKSALERSAFDAGRSIGMFMNVIIWGAVVVPLGIVALIAKPNQVVVVRREDPRLQTRD